MSLSLRSVVVPTDLTELSRPAFYHALRVALAAGASLRLLNVSPAASSAGWDDFPSVRETLHAWRLIPEPSKQAVAELGLSVDKVRARGRDPVRGILHHLRREPAGLVVLAAHRRQGLRRLFQPEVARPVVYQYGARSLILPQGVAGFVDPGSGALSLRHVVIPVGTELDAQLAVDAASRLARVLELDKPRFTLLHVGASSEQPELYLPQEPGWSWRREQRLEGEVVEEVLGFLDADLITLTTQGRGGLRDTLLGSTAEQLIARAACPVLAVPVKAGS